MKKDKLFGEWMRLLINLSATGEAGLEIWEEIEARYGENGRYYHTLDHVAAVLQTVEELKPLTSNYHAVQLAAWFHDIIYNPKATDNERQSALYAESLLGKLPVLAPLIPKVSRLIAATAGHANPDNDPDTAVLLDADLAVLGDDEETFRAYCEAIRLEYSWVPAQVYREKRVEVLRGFLERPQIYHTPLLHHRLETKARENLVGEIGRLS